MIKATGKWAGRDTLFIGLSFENLDKLRAEPLDSCIPVKSDEIGLPFNVLVFSGRTEAEMIGVLASGFGPNTKVDIDNRSKN